MSKKKRNVANYFSRKSSQIPQNPIILIYCEGKNTEPSYFKHFKIPTVTIETFGDGLNTTSLVNEAKKYASQKKYEKVWCVFDKDDFLPDDFDSAIQLAQNYGFQVAYSNQAFEYWLILHFEDHQGSPLDRKDYITKINKHLKKFKIQYDKSKTINQDFFDLLMSNTQKNQKRVELAIDRAKKIHQNFEKNQVKPSKAESSTTVYLLVEELLKYAN